MDRLPIGPQIANLPHLENCQPVNAADHRFRTNQIGSPNALATAESSPSTCLAAFRVEQAQLSRIHGPRELHACDQHVAAPARNDALKTGGLT